MEVSEQRFRDADCVHADERQRVVPRWISSIHLDFTAMW
jgi:hypothetical protein